MRVIFLLPPSRGPCLDICLRRSIPSPHFGRLVRLAWRRCSHTSGTPLSFSGYTRPFVLQQILKISGHMVALLNSWLFVAAAVSVSLALLLVDAAPKFFFPAHDRFALPVPYERRRIGFPLTWRPDFALIDLMEHAIGGLVPPPYWVAPDNRTFNVEPDLSMLYHLGRPACISAASVPIYHPFEAANDSNATSWRCAFACDEGQGEVDFSALPPLISRFELTSFSKESTLAFRGLPSMPATVHTLSFSGAFAALRAAMSVGRLSNLIPGTVGWLILNNTLTEKSATTFAFTVPATLPASLSRLSLLGTSGHVIGPGGLLPLEIQFNDGINLVRPVTTNMTLEREIVAYFNNASCTFAPGGSLSLCDSGQVKWISTMLGWTHAAFALGAANFNYYSGVICDTANLPGSLLDLSVLPTTVRYLSIDVAEVMKCHAGLDSILLNTDHLHAGLETLDIVNSGSTNPRWGVPDDDSKVSPRIFNPAFLPRSLRSFKVALKTDLFLDGPINLEAMPPALTLLDLRGVQLYPRNDTTASSSRVYVLPQTVMYNLTLVLPPWLGVRGPPLLPGGPPTLAWYSLSAEQRERNVQLTIQLTAANLPQIYFQAATGGATGSMRLGINESVAKSCTIPGCAVCSSLEPLACATKAGIVSVPVYAALSPRQLFNKASYNRSQFGRVTAASWNPQAESLALVTFNGGLSQFNGLVRLDFDLATDMAASVAVPFGTNFLACGTVDNFIRLFDRYTSDLISTFSDGVYCDASLEFVQSFKPTNPGVPEPATEGFAVMNRRVHYIRDNLSVNNDIVQLESTDVIRMAVEIGFQRLFILVLSSNGTLTYRVVAFRNAIWQIVSSVPADGVMASTSIASLLGEASSAACWDEAFVLNGTLVADGNWHVRVPAWWIDRKSSRFDYGSSPDFASIGYVPGTGGLCAFRIPVATVNLAFVMTASPIDCSLPGPLRLTFPPNDPILKVFFGVALPNGAFALAVYRGREGGTDLYDGVLITVELTSALAQVFPTSYPWTAGRSGKPPVMTAAAIRQRGANGFAYWPDMHGVVSASPEGVFVAFLGRSATRPLRLLSSSSATLVGDRRLVVLMRPHSTVLVGSVSVLYHIELLAAPYTPLSPIVFAASLPDHYLHPVHLAVERKLVMYGNGLLAAFRINVGSPAEVTGSSPDIFSLPAGVDGVAALQYHAPTSTLFFLDDPACAVDQQVKLTRVSTGSVTRQETLPLDCDSRTAKLFVPQFARDIVVFISGNRNRTAVKEQVGGYPRVGVSSVKPGSSWLTAAASTDHVGIARSNDWGLPSYGYLFAARRRLVLSSGRTTTRVRDMWFEVDGDEIVAERTLLGGDENTLVVRLPDGGGGSGETSGLERLDVLGAITGLDALVVHNVSSSDAATRQVVPLSTSLPGPCRAVSSFNRSHVAVLCETTVVFINVDTDDGEYKTMVPIQYRRFPRLSPESPVPSDGPLPFGNVSSLTFAAEWFDGSWLLLDRAGSLPRLFHPLTNSLSTVRSDGPNLSLAVLSMHPVSDAAAVAVHVETGAIYLLTARQNTSVSWTFIDHMFSTVAIDPVPQAAVAFCSVPGLMFCSLRENATDYRWSMNCRNESFFEGIAAGGAEGLKVEFGSLISGTLHDSCSGPTHNVSSSGMNGDITELAVILTCTDILTGRQNTAWHVIVIVNAADDAALEVESVRMLNATQNFSPFPFPIINLAYHSTGAIVAVDAASTTSIVWRLPGSFAVVDRTQRSTSSLAASVYSADATIVQSFPKDHSVWKRTLTGTAMFTSSQVPIATNSETNFWPNWRTPLDSDDGAAYASSFWGNYLTATRWLAGALAIAVVPGTELLIAATRRSTDDALSFVTFCDVENDRMSTIVHAHVPSIEVPPGVGVAIAASSSRVYVSIGFKVFAISTIIPRLQDECEAGAAADRPPVAREVGVSAAAVLLLTVPLPGLAEIPGAMAIRPFLKVGSLTEAIVAAAWSWSDTSGARSCRALAIDTMARAPPTVLRLPPESSIILGLAVDDTEGGTSILVATCNCTASAQCASLANVSQCRVIEFSGEDVVPMQRPDTFATPLRTSPLATFVDPFSVIPEVRDGTAVIQSWTTQLNSWTTVTASAFLAAGRAVVVHYFPRLRPEWNRTFGFEFHSRTNSPIERTFGGLASILTPDGYSKIGWNATAGMTRFDDVIMGAGRIFILGDGGDGNQSVFVVANPKYIATSRRNVQLSSRGVSTGLGSASSMPRHIGNPNGFGFTYTVAQRYNTASSTYRSKRVTSSLTAVTCAFSGPTGTVWHAVLTTQSAEGTVTSSSFDVDLGDADRPPTWVLSINLTHVFHSASKVARRNRNNGQLKVLSCNSIANKYSLAVNVSSSSCFAAVAAIPYRNSAAVVAADRDGNAIRVVDLFLAPRWTEQLAGPPGVWSRPSAVVVLRVSNNTGQLFSAASDPLHDCAVLFIAIGIDGTIHLFKWYRGTTVQTFAASAAQLFVWHGDSSSDNDLAPGNLFAFTTGERLRRSGHIEVVGGCLWALDAASWTIDDALPVTPVLCGGRDDNRTSLYDSSLWNSSGAEQLRQPIPDVLSTAGHEAFETQFLVSMAAPEWVYQNGTSLVVDDGFDTVELAARSRPTTGRVCGEVRFISLPAPAGGDEGAHSHTIGLRVVSAIAAAQPTVTVAWRAGRVSIVQLPLFFTDSAPPSVTYRDFPAPIVDARYIAPLQLMLILRPTCVTVSHAADPTPTETTLAGNCVVTANLSTVVSDFGNASIPATAARFADLTSFELLVNASLFSLTQFRLVLVDAAMGCLIVVDGIDVTLARASILSCPSVGSALSNETLFFNRSNAAVARVSALPGGSMILFQRNNGSAFLLSQASTLDQDSLAAASRRVVVEKTAACLSLMSRDDALLADGSIASSPDFGVTVMTENTIHLAIPKVVSGGANLAERTDGGAYGAFAFLNISSSATVCPAFEPLTGTVVTLTPNGRSLVLLEMCRRYSNTTVGTHNLSNPLINSATDPVAIAQRPVSYRLATDVVPLDGTAELVSLIPTKFGTAWAAAPTLRLVVLLQLAAVNTTWLGNASLRLGNASAPALARDGRWSDSLCDDCALFQRPFEVQLADGTCTRLFVLDAGVIRIVAAADCAVGFSTATYVRTVLSQNVPPSADCSPLLDDWDGLDRWQLFTSITSDPVLDATARPPLPNASSMLVSVLYALTSSGTMVAIVLTHDGNGTTKASTASTTPFIGGTCGLTFSDVDPNVAYVTLCRGVIGVVRRQLAVDPETRLPTHAANVSVFTMLFQLPGTVNGTKASTMAIAAGVADSDVILTADATGEGYGLSLVTVPSSDIAQGGGTGRSSVVPLVLRRQQPPTAAILTGGAFSSANATLPAVAAVAIAAGMPGVTGLRPIVSFGANAGSAVWYILDKLDNATATSWQSLTTSRRNAFDFGSRTARTGTWFDVVDNAIRHCRTVTSTLTSTTSMTNTTSATNTTSMTNTTDTITSTTSTTTFTVTTTTPSSTTTIGGVATSVATNVTPPACPAPFLVVVGFNAAVTTWAADGTLLARIRANASATTQSPVGSAPPLPLSIASQLPEEVSSRNLRRSWNVTVGVLGGRSRRPESINASQSAWLSASFAGSWADAFEVVPDDVPSSAQRFKSSPFEPRCSGPGVMTEAAVLSERVVVLSFNGDVTVDASIKHRLRCDFDPRMFLCPFAAASDRASIADVMSAGVSSAEMEFAADIQPLPAAVEASLRQTAFSAGAMSFVSGSPAVASQMARANMALSLSQCDFDHEAPLDFANSPMGFVFGPSIGAAYRGGIVGNTTLWLVMAALHLLVGVAMHAVRRHKSSGTRNADDGGDKWLLGFRIAPGSFAESLCHAKFPGLLAVPLAMVVPGLAMCSTALAVHGVGPEDVVLGVVGLLGTMAVIVLVTITVVRHFNAVYTKDISIDPITEKKSEPHPILKFFNGAMRWKSPTPNNFFKKVFTPLFEDYRSGDSDRSSRLPHVPLQYLFGVELGLSYLCGVLDGTRPNTFAGCRTAAALALVINLLWLMFAVLYLPCSSFYRNLFLIGNATLITASLGLAVASHVSQNEAFATAAAGVAAVSMYVTLVKAIADLVMMFRDVWEEWRKARHRAGRPISAKESPADGPAAALLSAVPIPQENLTPVDSVATASRADSIPPTEEMEDAPADAAIAAQPTSRLGLIVSSSSSSSSSSPALSPASPMVEPAKRATHRFDYFDLEGLDEVAATVAMPAEPETDHTRNFTDTRAREISRSAEAQRLLDAWSGGYSSHVAAPTTVRTLQAADDPVNGADAAEARRRQAQRMLMDDDDLL